MFYVNQPAHVRDMAWYKTYINLLLFASETQTFKSSKLK